MRGNKAVDGFGRLVAPYRGLGPSLWSMFAATMINRFGDFVGVFLALYLSKVQGCDATQAGVVVSLAYAASALGSLVSGRLADSFGRKRCLVACQVACSLANCLLGFVYALPWAPWVAVAGSAFRGGARPLIGAVLTDLAPAGKRKEVFALQYWSINVGVSLGPLVASALFERALPWLFRADALCSLASAFLIASRVRAVAAAPGTGLERDDRRGALRAFLARPILLAFAGLSLASSLTYSQTGFALPLTVSTRLGEAGPRSFGLLMSLNATLVLVLGIPVARLLRSRNPLWCMSVSGLFYVVGFALLAVPGGRALLVLSTLAWTLGEIVDSVNKGVFVAKHSPANWRGSFQSFLALFFSAGWSLGPLLSGPLLGSGEGSRGIALLWCSAAAACGLWSVGAIAVDRWDRRLDAAAGGM